MDKTKGVFKGGWHPKGKDGGKESWRGDNPGINKVANLVGKGKSSNSTSSTAKDHTSRPLPSLKDPAAFGPPPKNVNYHGGSAVPNAITPDRRGLGAPLSADELQRKEDEERGRQEDAQKPPPPPIPYRVDRTGLRTDTLPTPPTRSIIDGPSESPTTKPKPSLPPRLPPRQNSLPAQASPISPPPSYTAATQVQSPAIKQSAISRLGGSGIKVPGFNIGSSPTSQGPAQQQHTPWNDPTPSSTSPTAINSLSTRLGGLKTTSSPPPSQSLTANGGGTTFAQKQAAVRTASNLNNDPSSVSLTDAKATASTANNFRERHGEQVATGWKAGNNLNKKYGFADKVGGYAGGGAASTQQQPAPMSSAGEWAGQPAGQTTGTVGGGNGFGQAAASALGGYKKGPPPPLPMQRGSSGTSASPPPVPLGSKPR